MGSVVPLKKSANSAYLELKNLLSEKLQRVENLIILKLKSDVNLIENTIERNLPGAFHLMKRAAGINYPTGPDKYQIKGIEEKLRLGALEKNMFADSVYFQWKTEMETRLSKLVLLKEEYEK